MTQKRLALTGHGWSFIPRPPFEIGRLPSTGDVVFVHHGVDGRRPKARLGVVGGSVRVALGPGTQDLEQVLLDWREDGADPALAWTLSHDAGYAFPWPAGTSVWSTRDHADWPVELTLAGGTEADEMLYVRGPFDRARAPTLPQFVADGMAIAGTTQLTGRCGQVERLELRYAREGREWTQWRALVPLGPAALALMTAQAPAERREPVLALVREVEERLGPVAS